MKRRTKWITCANTENAIESSEYPTPTCENSCKRWAIGYHEMRSKCPGPGYFKWLRLWWKTFEGVWVDLDLVSDKPASSQNKLQSMRGLKIKGIPQLAEFLGSSKWRKKEMLGHTPFSEVECEVKHDSALKLLLFSWCDVQLILLRQNTQQAFGWLKIRVYHFKGCFPAAPPEVCSIRSGWRSWDTAASRTFLLF